MPWASSGDDRVTRVGRVIRLTRIDEIPQMWNVLKNEMSFVGPRPERPFFVDELRKQIPYYREAEAEKEAELQRLINVHQSEAKKDPSPLEDDPPGKRPRKVRERNQY